MAEDTKEEEEFHWRYAPLVTKAGGQEFFHVCEEYPGVGYTGPNSPMGESMDELIEELEMMLKDMKDAHAIGHKIVDGQPYDDWRLRQRAGEETIPLEEFEKELLEEIEEAPTVPFGESYEE